MVKISGGGKTRASFNGQFLSWGQQPDIFKKYLVVLAALVGTRFSDYRNNQRLLTDAFVCMPIPCR